MVKTEQKQMKEESSKYSNLSIRGRKFQGKVSRIVGQRVVVEWERTIYYPKYERFGKSKSKLHAYIPKEFLEDLQVGDYIEIGECRPLSKLVHFVMLRRIKQ